MARIRTIKPEFWSSEKIVECSPIARLLFIGLWNFADDGGVVPLKPKTIKMQIFPGDDEDSSSIRRMIDELSSNGLVSVYIIEDQEFLFINGWAEHQKVDRPNPKHPGPLNPRNRISTDAFDDRSTSAHPRKGRETEGKGREGKRIKNPPNPPDVTEPARDATTSDRPPDTPATHESPTRTATPRPRTPEPWVEWARKVKAIVGERWPNDERVLKLDGGLCRQWHADGYDLDRDVLPVVTRLCGEYRDDKPLGSLNYFTGAIGKRHRERLAEKASGTADAISDADAIAALRAMLETAYRRDGVWRDAWPWRPEMGFRPDDPRYVWESRT